MKKGNLFVLSAPSGTGKTTVCRNLAKRVENLILSISYTTRPMKEGEKDGVDYHFVDEKTFAEMVQARDFLEWANIYGYRYGTSRKAVEECLGSGTDFLLEIDVQGGMNVKEAMPEAVLIALFPPDRETLYERLRGRKREAEREIEERVREAMRELVILKDYDYFVINRDLEKAIKDVILIIESQNLRVDRNREFLEKLVLQFRR
ncbi:MAG: guanylate kinase [Deltaproteobacteria bacterium]|nr:guanylate kinase [Deltaproteobacteria bacterium]NIS78199.1 guanylate kinase [Deltaproteobacteria bacterium]